MLICFMPVTFLGIAVIAVAMSGDMPLRDALLYLSLAAIGPIGLIVAFRMVILQRIEMSGFALVALCVPAAWTALAFFVSVLGNVAPIDEWWRELVLIALLPIIGAAHLTFIARRSANRLLVR